MLSESIAMNVKHALYNTIRDEDTQYNDILMEECTSWRSWRGLAASEPSQGGYVPQ